MTRPIAVEAMTHCPISVPADTPIGTVAAILAANRISAVPVVDNRRPVGVVSEVDLVRAGLRTTRDRGELTARDLMTGPVVGVAPDEPLSSAARRLADAGVRRLFVVEDGRLVGVLTRRDMLRGYLRDDEDIRQQVERDVLASLDGRGAVVRATVRDGVVLLLGRVEYRSELRGIDTVVREVPGVVEVRNRMSFLWNDTPRSTSRVKAGAR